MTNFTHRLSQSVSRRSDFLYTPLQYHGTRGEAVQEVQRVDKVHARQLGTLAGLPAAPLSDVLQCFGGS